jgi:hypothetical protein
MSDQTSQNNVGTGNVVLTLEPAVAQGYVDNWQQGDYQFIPSSVTPASGQLQLNSFSFNLDDFKFLVERIDLYNDNNPNTPIEFIISRIGLKPSTTGDSIPCMFFEPLSGALPGVLTPEILPLNDSGTKSACYDVSYPCPPTCAVPK